MTRASSVIAFSRYASFNKLPGPLAPAPLRPVIAFSRYASFNKSFLSISFHYKNV